MRYTAWGETRFTSGTSPSNYRYTGQRQEVSFGLYFYNARWYDGSLGRFTQADTIIPGGVQGLDRYAYVSNNPVVYNDPSGHSEECGLGEQNCRAGKIVKTPPPPIRATPTVAATPTFPLPIASGSSSTPPSCMGIPCTGANAQQQATPTVGKCPRDMTCIGSPLQTTTPVSTPTLFVHGLKISETVIQEWGPQVIEKPSLQITPDVSFAVADWINGTAQYLGFTFRTGFGPGDFYSGRVVYVLVAKAVSRTADIITVASGAVGATTSEFFPLVVPRYLFDNMPNGGYEQWH